MISSSLSSSCLPEPLVGGLVEIADAGVALLGQSGAGGKRKLVAAAGVQLPELGHAPQLLGVVCSRSLSWSIWKPASRQSLE